MINGQYSSLGFDLSEILLSRYKSDISKAIQCVLPVINIFLVSQSRNISFSCNKSSAEK